MLTPHQLLALADATSLLRGKVEVAIVPPPTSPTTLIAFARLSASERETQRDLTAASAHLAQAAVLFHRVADRVAPVIELVL